MDVMKLTGIRLERHGKNSTDEMSAANDNHDSFHSDAGLRHRQSTVSVDLVMQCDLQQAGRSSDITQTVDYEQLAHRVASVIERDERGLLETLAYDVAHAVLLSHLIHEVEVTAHRARSIRGVHVDDVSVTIRCAAEHHEQFGEKLTSKRSNSLAAQSDAHHTQASHVAASAHADQQEASAQSTETSQPETREALIALQTSIVNDQAADAQATLRAAVVAIDSVPGNQVVGISPLYQCGSITDNDSFNAVVMIETSLNNADIHSSLTLLEHAHQSSDNQYTEMRDDSSHQSRCLRATLLDLRSRHHEKEAEQRSVLPSVASHAEILAPWNDLNATIQQPDAVDTATMLESLLRDAPNRENIIKVSDTWILGGAV
ncbi:dihydroneopterin aldolase [Bifidobacterium aquikefiri]|uniref:dihydroneopterin aldolase n=2 Tax=Bifidobacterium aquikefiri TaxID=1653207 RepID=UPI0023F17DC5|nr:dihydroneopterin aldolase [Bifidobacterium aquikefiri]